MSFEIFPLLAGKTISEKDALLILRSQIDTASARLNKAFDEVTTSGYISSSDEGSFMPFGRIAIHSSILNQYLYNNSSLKRFQFDSLLFSNTSSSALPETQEDFIQNIKNKVTSCGQPLPISMVHTLAASVGADVTDVDSIKQALRLSSRTVVDYDSFIESVQQAYSSETVSDELALRVTSYVTAIHARLFKNTLSDTDIEETYDSVVENYYHHFGLYMGNLIPVLTNASTILTNFDEALKSVSEQLNLSSVYDCAIDAAISCLDAGGSLNEKFSSLVQSRGLTANANLNYLISRLSDTISAYGMNASWETIMSMIEVTTGDIESLQQDDVKALLSVEKQQYTGCSLGQILGYKAYELFTTTLDQIIEDPVGTVELVVDTIQTTAYNAIKFYFTSVKWIWTNIGKLLSKGFHRVVNWFTTTFTNPVDFSIIDGISDDLSFDEGYIKQSFDLDLYPNIENHLNNHPNQLLYFPVLGGSIYIQKDSDDTTQFDVYLKKHLYNKHAAKTLSGAIDVSWTNEQFMSLSQGLNFKQDELDASSSYASDYEVEAYQGLAYSSWLLVAGLMFLYGEDPESIAAQGSFSDTWLWFNDKSKSRVDGLQTVTNSDFLTLLTYCNIDLSNVASNIDDILDGDRWYPYLWKTSQCSAQYHLLTDEENKDNSIHTLILTGIAVGAIALAVTGIVVGVKFRKLSFNAQTTADMIAFGEDPNIVNLDAAWVASRRSKILSLLSGTYESGAYTVGSNIVQKVLHSDNKVISDAIDQKEIDFGPVIDLIH